ncbi:MAG: ROK family protein [Thermodesulfovibrionales bacterium]|nr:ROK family protein [Thermodesulfovibrionales bacterium]
MDIIAIDIGGTNIRSAIVRIEGDSYEIVKKVKVQTGQSPLESLVSSVDGLLYKTVCDIYAVGISVAGIVDKHTGILLKSPNIPKLEGINLRDFVSERIKDTDRFIIENDANAAAYGEAIAGAGREFDDFVLFTLGTGIGGGVVLERKLLNIPAEIGHMSINNEGLQCPCGNVGCLETVASASAIINRVVGEIQNGAETIMKRLYNGNFYKINAQDIYNSALEGDLLARNVLRDAGKGLGIGIANVVNIFMPDAVILTGGLIGAWNIYVDSAIKEAHRRAMKELISKTRILPSILGDDAGLIGIAYLVKGL